MSIDLIISEHGKVLIAANAPFADEVVRVDFDVEHRLITLNYAGRDIAPETLDLPVNAHLTPMLRQAPRVLLVALDGGAMRQGYDVPLTCIEHA